MENEEHFYDSLEEDEGDPTPPQPPPIKQITKSPSKLRKPSSSHHEFQKHEQEEPESDDFDLSTMVPLYQGETDKEQIKSLRSSRKKNALKKAISQDDKFVNNPSNNELKSLTCNKLALLKSLKPSKSYLSMFHARIGYPEKGDCPMSNSVKNQFLKETTRAVDGDLTTRTELTSLSRTSFVSDSESFYLDVIKQEEFIVPPLDLKSDGSNQDFSRSSSFTSNSAASFNQNSNQIRKSSGSVKVLKKITPSTIPSGTGSEIYLKKAAANMQMSSWKKRQQYGKIASERNIIKLKELKTLKELDVM